MTRKRTFEELDQKRSQQIFSTLKPGDFDQLRLILEPVSPTDDTAAAQDKYSSGVVKVHALVLSFAADERERRSRTPNGELWEKLTAAAREQAKEYESFKQDMDASLSKAIRSMEITKQLGRDKCRALFLEVNPGLEALLEIDDSIVQHHINQCAGIIDAAEKKLGQRYVTNDDVYLACQNAGKTLGVMGAESSWAKTN